VLGGRGFRARRGGNGGAVIGIGSRHRQRRRLGRCRTVEHLPRLECEAVVRRPQQRGVRGARLGDVAAAAVLSGAMEHSGGVNRMDQA
jgi:hypothetical protein